MQQREMNRKRERKKESVGKRRKLQKSSLSRDKTPTEIISGYGLAGFLIELVA